MPTVGVNKIASALNLSTQRVQQLVQEGLPREARGQYDPIKCLHFYIRYLQAAIERRTAPIDGDGVANERVARVRILQTQADLKEMELARLRSQLVAVRDVDATLDHLVRATTARIMAIPPRLAPELIGEQSRAVLQMKVEKACKQALSDLAKAWPGGNTEALATKARARESSNQNRPRSIITA